MKINSLPAKILLSLVKYSLAIVYIVAGILKAVDINNTQIKIQDYFTSFGLSYLNFLSNPLSFFLIGLEIFIGITILLDLNKRIVPKLTVALTAFMFLLTAYIFIYNPISDCGCLGSAYILTNDETFYKNIVLIIFALIYYKTHPHVSFISYTNHQNRILTLYCILYIGCFLFINYSYTPIVDLSIYHVGYNLNEKPNKQILTYVFKKKGEEKIFTDDTAPWNDDSWTFVKVKEFGNTQYRNFNIERLEFNLDPLSVRSKENITDSLYKGLSILIILENISDLKENENYKIQHWTQQLDAPFNSIYLITSESDNNILNKLQEIPYNWHICQIDNTEIFKLLNNNKVQIIILNDGKIIKKWHTTNLPNKTDWEAIKNIQSVSQLHFFIRNLLISISSFIIPFLFLKNRFHS